MADSWTFPLNFVFHWIKCYMHYKNLLWTDERIETSNFFHCKRGDPQNLSGALSCKTVTYRRGKKLRPASRKTWLSGGAYLYIKDKLRPQKTKNWGCFFLIHHSYPGCIYNGMSLLYLKNHKNEQKITAPHIPVIMRTHLNAPSLSNNGIVKFIPKIPATTPKMATTNVAVVSSSSNWISWFRTLSCTNNKRSM